MQHRKNNRSCVFIEHLLIKNEENATDPVNKIINPSPQFIRIFFLDIIYNSTTVRQVHMLQ